MALPDAPPGGLITGAEIMLQHGVLAVDIGQACYNGNLHAFTEARTPILENTKIAKIPKYPPPTVEPLEHVQYLTRESSRPFTNTHSKKVVQG